MSSNRLGGSKRRPRLLRWGDRGSGTPELVVILPLLLFLITLSMQFALWALASHALSDAVAQGGAVLRANGGTSTAARTVVTRELRTLANGLVLRPTVSVRSLPDGVDSLSASGALPSLLPGVRLTVSAQSAGPRQQFRASG
ncbi:MAG: TadE/TadG family type IV pilus assembly protein [Acidimicrobiales bacterium]